MSACTSKFTRKSQILFVIINKDTKAFCQFCHINFLKDNICVSKRSTQFLIINIKYARCDN